MLETKEVQKALDRFTKKVVDESKSNLKKSINGRVKNTSGKLLKSIKGTSKAMPNSISVDFSMEDYGQFQDKGVSGKYKKFDTPFTYKNAAPPTKALDRWIVRKGLAPRNSKGRFTGRSVNSVGFAKSISFLIARKIYFNGIKPSLFFSNPFNTHFKKLPNELISKFGLDAASLFSHAITQPKK
jgi:hypothetical protein